MWHRLHSQNGVLNIYTNQELMNLYIETDIILEIRKARLLWLGHSGIKQVRRKNREECV
jgi:hypothetical protein